MFKGNRKYVFFLLACFGILIVLQLIAPKAVNWKLSYMKKDKIPYGTAALYELLPFLFPEETILVKEIPLYNALNNIKFQGALYVIINRQFEPDKLDLRELMNFVKAGNTAFISANHFSQALEDTLGFKTELFFNTPLKIEADSTGAKNKYKLKRGTLLNFFNPVLKTTKGYEFEILENSYFSRLDTSKTILLGNMQKNRINFIKIPLGKGCFFLHSTPEVFANVNFLKPENTAYVERTFANASARQVIWDDYYKIGKIRNDNPLRVIMSHAPLATAYYVLLISMVLFILIGVKRRQRIIPVMEPVTNTTLEFVNIIGALFYQQRSHKEIAEMQIHHFLASVRSIFRITAPEQDDLFIDRLSALSAIDKNQLKGLMNYIAYIRSKSIVYEQELILLNKMIENFYNNSKRPNGINN
jgi:hypothetical protein